LLGLAHDGDGGGGPVVATLRVGLTRGTGSPWRFILEGSPWVSPGPREAGPRERGPTEAGSTKAGPTESGPREAGEVLAGS
jgi:hypothetical protein